MLSRLHLSAIILVAAGVWGGMLLLEGTALTVTWFRPFSMVVGVLVLLLVVFDLWAWRIRLFHPWFVARPDLRGTWRAELKSDWKDEATGEVTGPIDVYLVFRQTFSTLSLRVLTAESTSELVAAEICKAVDGTYRLGAVYKNEPRLSIRDRSSIHYGALVLDVQGDPVANLAGHYWTERKTRGELRTLAKHASIAASFSEAQSMLSAKEARFPVAKT
jgi:hypothetical protein